MTTRYRVEYALKTHRRDQFVRKTSLNVASIVIESSLNPNPPQIEWIKGLLAVPFVLYSEPILALEQNGNVEQMADTASKRYADVFFDVEKLINDHIVHQKADTVSRSKLKLLVPSIGSFFTPLSLRDAFLYEDSRRHISSRRFVAPSFNDIRIILNTAQVLSLVREGPLELVTFDGDVTLYDDGGSIHPDSPVIERILGLISRGVKVGIVTAAGYTDASRYYERLYGLLDAVETRGIEKSQHHNLIVMGGESNFLFRFDENSECKLVAVPRVQWALPEMLRWKDDDITELLDTAEEALKKCVESMHLHAQILRKERAVGIIPMRGHKFEREQLEETVLVTQKILENSAVGRRLPFCAFNGGNDVFVDIGDKSLGVMACQAYFGGIGGGSTLHVGDQFLSAGANDFKARLACTTAWIASPAETLKLLDQITEGC